MRFTTRRRRVAAGPNLFVPAKLLAQIRAEAMSFAPDETGGMLIGYRADQHATSDVAVTGLIGAGPAAERARHRFVPDGPWQYEQLLRVYESSGRISVYLGDWHSHPRGSSRLSPTDLATYRRVAADHDAQTPHPVVLIAARRRRNGWGAWTIDDGEVFAMQVVATPSEEPC